MNTEQDPMQDAIKILLDRMENHPEEFVKDDDFKVNKYTIDADVYSRFWKIATFIRRSMVSDNSVQEDPLWFLNDIERQRLYEALRGAARQAFVKSVVTTLNAPEVDPKVFMQERLQAANIAANNLYQTVTTGNTTIAQPSACLLDAKERMKKAEYDRDRAAQNIYGGRI